ncbi:TPA: hypothetical protein ACGW44_005535, partial [Bacillus toyonensis]
MHNLIHNGSFQKGLHGWNVDGNPLQIQFKDTLNGRCVQIPFKNSISQKVDVKEKTSYSFQCQIEHIPTGALQVTIKEWMLGDNGLEKIGHVYQFDQHSMQYQKITTNPNVNVLEVIIENKDYTPTMIQSIELIAIPNESNHFHMPVSSNSIQKIDLKMYPNDSYWIAIGDIGMQTHVGYMYTLSAEVRAKSPLLHSVQIAMGIFHTNSPQTIVARSTDYTIVDDTPITVTLAYKPKDSFSLFNRMIVQSPIPLVISNAVITTESPYYPSNTESSYPTGTTESPYYPSNTESSYPTGTTESPYYPSNTES